MGFCLRDEEQHGSPLNQKDLSYFKTIANAVWFDVMASLEVPSLPNLHLQTEKFDSREQQGWAV